MKLPLISYIFPFLEEKTIVEWQKILGVVVDMSRNSQSDRMTKREFLSLLEVKNI